MAAQSLGLEDVYKRQAADDKVDATLHDIKVGQETAEDYYQEESWKRSNEAEDLHLQYLNGSENLEYGPVDGKGTTTWRNEVGWSRLCLLYTSQSIQCFGESSCEERDLWIE